MIQKFPFENDIRFPVPEKPAGTFISARAYMPKPACDWISRPSQADTADVTVMTRGNGLKVKSAEEWMKWRKASH